MTAYIAYDNKIPLGTVTAPETPGFEKENAFDWFTYTWWKSPSVTGYTFSVEFPAPVTIDYCAFAGHNMGDVESLVYFRMDDGSDVMPAFSPTNNKPLFFTFPERTDTRFYFSFFSEIASPFIGVMSFGQVLALPEGIKPAFTPPQWGHDDKITTVMSQTGQFLGRSVERYGLKHNITQTQVDPEWMRENWLSLAAGIRANPFFYSWNQEEYPEDAVYSWLDDKLPNPIYTSPIYTDFTLKCKALYDSE